MWQRFRMLRVRHRSATFRFPGRAPAARPRCSRVFSIRSTPCFSGQHPRLGMSRFRVRRAAIGIRDCRRKTRLAASAPISGLTSPAMYFTMVDHPSTVMAVFAAGQIIAGRNCSMLQGLILLSPGCNCAQLAPQTARAHYPIPREHSELSHLLRNLRPCDPSLLRH